MTIPFLNLFKRKAAVEIPRTSTPPAAIEKPSGERMSKTVLPNASRTVTPRDNFQSSSPAGAMGGGAPRVPFSLGGAPGGTRSNDLPPAVALALEPKVERVISLQLSEVASQMPAGWIRPVSEAEGDRPVLLRAAEIEKGMSGGKPTVSVASIYRQIPEIFVKPVPEGDDSQVQLPFAKVMEQFGKLQLRDDQYRDQTVPQVETPFLKVTLEDNSKFGTTMGPVVTGDLPAVRLEPATAHAFAAAEPEGLLREKFIATPVRMPTPPSMAAPAVAKTNGSNPVVMPPPAPAIAEPPAPTRIPFKISPTGPDAPATERVPASRGPSVPTSPEPPAPTRIPFKMTPLVKTPPDKAEPWLTKDNFEEGAEKAIEAASTKEAEVKSAPAAVDSEIKISLPLKPVLQALPPFQLIGDLNNIPEDSRFELPFALVEPQLSSGRVSVKPDEFAAALPSEYKGFFSSKEIAAAVAIPLQEVLKNLPSASLRMRDDQVEQEKGADFATPFSAKAEEDAKRFNFTGATVVAPLKGTVAKAKPANAPPLAPAPAVEASAAVVAQTPPKTSGPLAPEAAPSSPKVAPFQMENAAPERSALQAVLDTDDELDAKAVVAHIGRMAGVKACAIMFGDGLSLAGNLPEVYEADGLCAMAPSLLEKIASHLTETRLGALRAMTLSCAEAAVTFLMDGNLCLAALHAREELASDVRERLERAVHELSKKYSHPI